MSLLSTFKLSLLALATSAGFIAGMGASFSAFAQYNPNIHNSAGNGMMDNAVPYNPAPYNPVAATGSGYTNDGTLMMGGQKIGNPHQILHDLNVPSFFGVNANRLTFTDNPSYGSGTLAQMEDHTLNIGVPAGNVVLSRLYLTPTNPYTEGAASTYNNYQTYQGVVADAQAGSYQLTVANDNKLYAFKTLGSMSTQSQNILIKELPAHSVFIANSDPKGGAVAVRVTQSGDYAAMQNYFDTVKPYDFGWRSAFGVYANDPNSASFVANWVMGSHQVQAYQANLQNQSMQSGNEAFGVLAWDANQNRYVMLDANNASATSGSVSGNMPTLGNNQFGFFGMHTHPGSAMPSGQDLRMTQQLGLDQLVLGTNGTTAIMTNKPSTAWQGARFEFESAYHDSVSGAGYGTNNGGDDTTGVGGVAAGGQSVDSTSGSYGYSYDPDTNTLTSRAGPVQIGGNSGNWSIGTPGQQFGNYAIIGGSREQSVALGNSVREIGGTSTGYTLDSLLGGSLVTMTVGANGAYASYGGALAAVNLNAGLRSIFIASDIIDNNGKCCYDSSTGRARATLTRVAAHEMGHLSGTGDDGPNDMNNVNKWENPIMNAVDPTSPNRTTYP